VTSIPLRPGLRLAESVQSLHAALEGGSRRSVGELAQQIADGICATLGVPRLRVLVQGRRPSSDWGELHGLYTPGGRSRTNTIKVWMITAKRGQVVAFRTFLRTLVHEICHHLDYTLLDLPDSLHTDGFYTRESSIVRRLTSAAGLDGAPRANGQQVALGAVGRPGRAAPTPG
jgi:hypothetical protein